MCFTIILFFSNRLTDIDGLSWMIRTESSLTDFKKPENQIDEVIIHPDFENYQNDIGKFLMKERKKNLSNVLNNVRVNRCQTINAGQQVWNRRDRFFCSFRRSDVASLWVNPFQSSLQNCEVSWVEMREFVLRRSFRRFGQNQEKKHL